MNSSGFSKTKSEIAQNRLVQNRTLTDMMSTRNRLMREATLRMRLIKNNNPQLLKSNRSINYKRSSLLAVKNGNISNKI